MFLACPNYAVIDLEFKCSLTLISNAAKMIVQVDFGDGKIQNYTMMDDTYPIVNFYQEFGEYNITAKTVGYILIEIASVQGLS